MADRPRNAPLLVAIVAAIVMLGITSVHLWIEPLPALATIENLVIDARFEVRGPRAPATDRVVIIGIDDDTRARYPDLMQTRRGYAALVRALAKYDVKVIAFDLFFSAPEVLLPDSFAAQVRAADAERRTAAPLDDEMPNAPLVRGDQRVPLGAAGSLWLNQRWKKEHKPAVARSASASTPARWRSAT